MNLPASSQLDAIIDRDARNAIRCLAAAERATEEGRLNLAKVLRATALAARTRALQLERLEDADSNSVDLLRVITDADSKSLASIAQSTDQSQRHLRFVAASGPIADILRRTSDALEDGRDVSERTVAQFLFGCEDCGYVAERSRPEICPACGSLAREWALFAPFYSATSEHISRRQPGEIVRMLRGDSAAFREALHGQDELLLAHRPAPDEWCVKEIAGHIIDIAELFNRRLGALRRPESDVPEATLLPWALIDGQDYPGRSVAELVTRFESAMGEALALIDALTDADWNRKADMLSGRVMVIDMASWLANHNVAHLEQIRARLT